MVGLSIPLHIYIPKLSDVLFEKMKQVDTNIKKSLEKKKIKKRKKERAKRIMKLFNLKNKKSLNIRYYKSKPEEVEEIINEN